MLQTGQIAHYLQFANQNTRTKLDELKRLEVRRLRDLHKKLRQEAVGRCFTRVPRLLVLYWILHVS